ncbi:MAG: TerB family tellurite resistance protein [Kiritimatiellae bacterium]|nr:TerB family tellurite resistance protein [Kiritimatiellia bacterium]
MGSIIGDLFKDIGSGIGKVFDGKVASGLGAVLAGIGNTMARTVGGAAKLFGLGDKDADPELLYLGGVVAMLAKMAKADGHVDATEIRLMKTLFRSWNLDNELQSNLQQWFNKTKSDNVSISEYAELVVNAAVQLSPKDEGLDLRIDAYRYLFLMAIADDNLDDSEIAILQSIPDALGLKDEIFDFMAHDLLGDNGPESGDTALEEAFEVLGVGANASDEEIQEAYKRKIGKFHPDMIQGKGLDAEWLEMANEKSAEINEAYNTVRNARKISRNHCRER